MIRIDIDKNKNLEQLLAETIKFAAKYHQAFHNRLGIHEIIEFRLVYALIKFRVETTKKQSATELE